MVLGASLLSAMCTHLKCFGDIICQRWVLWSITCVMRYNYPQPVMWRASMGILLLATTLLNGSVVLASYMTTSGPL